MGGADWHSDSRDCALPLERSRQMKLLLLTTIAAVVLVGTALADPIHDAADAGDLAGVQAELDKGVNVNAKEDDYGWTPLHGAADYGHKEIAELLIAKGADVNAQDEDGVTPLHLAAWEGQTEIAELLIAKGADVNAKEEFYGWTPLHNVADYGHKEIAALLIAKGADVNAKDFGGNTPLDGAEEVSEDDSPEDKAAKKETADLLRKHGGTTGAELKAEGK